MTEHSGALAAHPFWKTALTHRLAVALLNAAVLLILAPSVVELAVELANWTGSSDRARAILAGLSTMLIGYGVVVEERAYINGKLGLYPTMLSDEEEAIDARCHSTGFAALSLGLLSEILFQSIDLPQTILNTQAIAWYLLLCSTIILAWVCVLLVLHACRMVLRRF
ncbi:hypothetical protein [Phreatobacter sp.]|uniref:hypothetical protein n=1 Tax=Phreatobacter sp. TaxID=1966341 RepID=UPI003F6F3D19